MLLACPLLLVTEKSGYPSYIMLWAFMTGQGMRNFTDAHAHQV